MQAAPTRSTINAYARSRTDSPLAVRRIVFVFHSRADDISFFFQPYEHARDAAFRHGDFLGQFQLVERLERANLHQNIELGGRQAEALQKFVRHLMAAVRVTIWMFVSRIGWGRGG